MSAVHIRQVDDAVVAELKRRAAANNRSLEAELRAILYAAAFPESAEGQRQPVKLKLRTVSVGGESTLRREEIYGDDGR